MSYQTKQKLNPVEALIYQSFDETRSLDFRHYSEKTLTEYRVLRCGCSGAGTVGGSG